MGGSLMAVLRHHQACLLGRCALRVRLGDALVCQGASRRRLCLGRRGRGVAGTRRAVSGRGRIDQLHEQALHRRGQRVDQRRLAMQPGEEPCAQRSAQRGVPLRAEHCDQLVEAMRLQRRKGKIDRLATAPCRRTDRSRAAWYLGGILRAGVGYVRAEGFIKVSEEGSRVGGWAYGSALRG